MSASNFQVTEHIYTYTSEKADHKGYGSCTASGSPRASPNKQPINLNHPPLTPKATKKPTPKPQTQPTKQKKKSTWFQSNRYFIHQAVIQRMVCPYLFVQTFTVQWEKASLHVARNSSMCCDLTKSAAAPRRIRFNSLPSAIFMQCKEQREH